MISRVLHPMDGPIPPMDCAQGALLAVENARNLLREATLLFENGLGPRANLLAMIGAEEVVKATLLVYATVMPSDSERKWRDFWWVVRSHDAKELFNYTLKFMRRGFPAPADFFRALEHTGTYLDVRNMSTYVDRVSSGWLIPTDLLRPSMVKNQVQELARRLEGFDSMKDANDVIEGAKSVDPSSFQRHSIFTEARGVVREFNRKPRRDRQRTLAALTRFLRSFPTNTKPG